MKSLGILSATVNGESGFIEVIKAIVNDDDSIEYAGHSFHPETLEWWAAVYGIEDKDEIIDMIMFEPYVDNVSPMNMSREDAKKEQQSKVTNFKQKYKRDVSRKNAAQAIRDSEVHDKYATAADRDPYEFIKAACPFDAEVIEVKKSHVDMIRGKNMESNDRTRSNEPSRKEELQRRLGYAAKRPSEESTRPKPPPPVILEKGKRKI